MPSSLTETSSFRQYCRDVNVLHVVEVVQHIEHFLELDRVAPAVPGDVDQLLRDLDVAVVHKSEIGRCAERLARPRTLIYQG